MLHDKERFLVDNRRIVSRHGFTFRNFLLRSLAAMRGELSKHGTIFQNRADERIVPEICAAECSCFLIIQFLRNRTPPVPVFGHFKNLFYQGNAGGNGNDLVAFLFQPSGDVGGERFFQHVLAFGLPDAFGALAFRGAFLVPMPPTLAA